MLNWVALGEGFLYFLIIKPVDSCLAQPKLILFWITTGWSKSLCVPEDYSTKTRKNTVFKQFQSPTMITYLELGITEHSSVSGDWRGTLWTLFENFCIVIIRCTETFSSPCIIKCCVWTVCLIVRYCINTVKMRHIKRGFSSNTLCMPCQGLFTNAPH